MAAKKRKEEEKKRKKPAKKPAKPKSSPKPRLAQGSKKAAAKKSAKKPAKKAAPVKTKKPAKKPVAKKAAKKGAKKHPSRSRELERQRRARELARKRSTRDREADKRRARERKIRAENIERELSKADAKLAKAKANERVIRAEIDRVRRKRAQKKAAAKKTIDAPIHGQFSESAPTVLTPDERNLAHSLTYYRELIEQGEIEKNEDVTRELDLDASPRGAVSEYRIPIGEVLDDAALEEILSQASAAVRSISTWHKQVYASVHMFQSDTSYDTSADAGTDARRSGKPDGKVWEDNEQKKRLFSTWQGVKATDAAGLLRGLESKLNLVQGANGRRATTIVHEVIIRGVLPEEMKKRETD